MSFSTAPSFLPPLSFPTASLLFELLSSAAATNYSLCLLPLPLTLHVVFPSYAFTSSPTDFSNFTAYFSPSAPFLLSANFLLLFHPSFCFPTLLSLAASLICCRFGLAPHLVSSPVTCFLLHQVSVSTGSLFSVASLHFL
jgi:hypothetical protein